LRRGKTSDGRGFESHRARAETLCSEVSRNYTSQRCYFVYSRGFYPNIDSKNGVFVKHLTSRDRGLLTRF